MTMREDHHRCLNTKTGWSVICALSESYRRVGIKFLKTLESAIQNIFIIDLSVSYA